MRLVRIDNDGSGGYKCSYYVDGTFMEGYQGYTSVQNCINDAHSRWPDVTVEVLSDVAE